MNRHIQENIPLAPLTTIGLGGPARYYSKVHDRETLCKAIQFARNHELPIFVLGGGSNVVIRDEGFNGLVIHMGLEEISFTEKDNAFHVTAGAGVVWDELVAACVERGCQGIECLSGIPGFVGAAPIQNIGAYGQEVAETIREVHVLELETLKATVVDNTACQFSYRDSFFKQQPDKFIVLSVCFVLPKVNRAVIRYPELAKRLPEQAGLKQARAAVLSIRAQKSMLVDPTDPNARSCGSFFVNPVLSERQYTAFQEKAGKPHPNYPVGEGRVKLSAAWLIENAGFSKGYIHGEVGLSAKHCLALINRGNGSTREILALKERIQKVVADTFGVVLVPEPRLI